MNPDKLNLIFIVGSGHSGSTLLDIYLGTSKVIQSGGEFKKFNELIEDKKKLLEFKNYCSCGQPIHNCDFWNDVLKKIKTNSLNVSSNAFDSYELYRSILQTSNKKYVVDSSKKIERLEMLAKSNLYNIYIIHLIRNPINYLSSCLNKLNRKQKNMGIIRRYFLLEKMAKQWLVNNKKVNSLFHGSPHYQVLKFEEFVKDPSGTTQRILKKYNIDNYFEAKNEIENNSHLISGNRLRHKNVIAINSQLPKMTSKVLYCFLLIRFKNLNNFYNKMNDLI